MHARAERREHRRVRLLLPIRFSKQDHRQLGAQTLRHGKSAGLENRQIAGPHEGRYVVHVIEYGDVGKLHALEHRAQVLRVCNVLTRQEHEVHTLELRR